MARRLAPSVMLLLGLLQGAAAMAQDTDAIEPFRAIRNGFVEKYRVENAQDTTVLVAAEPGLQRLADAAQGAARGAALLELGTFRRLRGAHMGAVAAFQAAATLARAAGNADLEFEAEIGTARAYNYAGREHGLGADAIERAAEAAGPAASRSQSHAYQLASYDAQLLDGRNELEAALVKVLVARRLAARLPVEDVASRFFAELDYGGILQHFATRCDYEKIVDDQTEQDGSSADGWEACRRAVQQARLAYQQSADLAQHAGWAALAQQAEQFGRNLMVRLFLIDSRARHDKTLLGLNMAPQERRDVIVNTNFEAGASTLQSNTQMRDLIDTVVADPVPGEAAVDTRRDYLRGLKRDLQGDNVGALAMFGQAAAGLATERANLFDARRRGTVIENRGEAVRDFAMRLLSMGRLAEAFDAFEQVRARGLGDVRAALAASDDPGDRDWLSRLLQREALLSTTQSRIAEIVIAGHGDDATLAPLLTRATQEEEARQALFAEPGADARKARLGRDAPTRARLADVQAAARATNTSLVFYWVVHPNIVVWHVGPDPSSTWARTVFLPQTILERMIAEVRQGLDAPDIPFARETAQQLYLRHYVASTTRRFSRVLL